MITKSQPERSGNGCLWLVLLTLFIGGLYLWASQTGGHPLILRNEVKIFGSPLPILGFGVFVCFIVVILIELVTIIQNRRLEWGWRVGRHRGSPLQWEDIIFFTVPSTFLGTIGLVLWLNSYLDMGSAQTYQAQVVERYVRTGSRGSESCYFRTSDWKKVINTLDLHVRCDIYYADQTSNSIEVITKSGFFGYEWVVDIKPIAH